ncbi:MAG TPA: tetratricopeptide repeat protein [Rhizomicrobium sp.]|nr:tetratricopeptide repeat protein [Rhizomicrobium sp.]
MDRHVDDSAFNDSDAWRIAALSMMSVEELHGVFAGDPVVAAPWVIAAANGGLAEAEVRLGRMLLSGEGVAKDERVAFAWFGRAAAQDNIEAHNMLGRCYENGWGTPQDFELAGKHYAIAACADDAWAQYNLGHLFLDGLGVPRDLDEAFAWYSRAAAQGHPRAMSLVGRCYEEGWGVARDAALARAWYRKSAEGGYFRGAFNFASLLVGEGCIAGGAHWFEKALATAPEPTRSNMVAMLSKSPHTRICAVALGMSDVSGATRRFDLTE